MRLEIAVLRMLSELSFPSKRMVFSVTAMKAKLANTLMTFLAVSLIATMAHAAAIPSKTQLTATRRRPAKASATKANPKSAAVLPLSGTPAVTGLSHSPQDPEGGVTPENPNIACSIAK
jgi:hypothetical protein